MGDRLGVEVLKFWIVLCGMHSGWCCWHVCFCVFSGLVGDDDEMRSVGGFLKGRKGGMA